MAETTILMAETTILNVDDYEPARHARTKILTRAGFDVTEASTGEQALKLALAKRPQLIVLDVNLPDISGTEVCRRIKSDPATAAVPVLHLSASSIRPADKVAGLENGADSYLTEPVEPAVLIATIRALLRTRQAEEAMRRANEELQHFTYAISHELNEPLRTIATHVQLLAMKVQDKLDSEAQTYVRDVIFAAQRLQSFVQDLLSFSRATSPERKFSPVSCDSLLVTALYELQGAIRDTGAVITHDPLPVVSGSELRLLMVFTNLISNALKYRSEQPPRVHISASSRGDSWVFTVSDNGLGIDPQYRDRIFGAFKRLHGREYPGSGIGLALCKRIIENHGGQIWVESTLGQGSTFCFTLPAAQISTAANSIQ